MAWHLLFGKNKFPETFASSKVSVFISDKGFVDRTLIRAAGIMLFYLELNGSVSGWVQNTKAVPKQIVKRKRLLPGPAECSVVTCLLVLQIVIHDELPSGHLSVFTWGSDKQWAIGHVLSCPLDHRYNTRFLVFAGNYETESNFFFLLKYSCVIHCFTCFTDNNIFNRWVWDTEIGRFYVIGQSRIKAESLAICMWSIIEFFSFSLPPKELDDFCFPTFELVFWLLKSWILHYYSFANNCISDITAPRWV